MRRVLILTLILVIPSFVLFYGWSQISRSQNNVDASYGKVVAEGGGQRQSMTVTSQEIEATRNRLLRPILFRAMSTSDSPQNFDFQKWEQLIRRGLSDLYLLHETGKNLAMENYARSLGYDFTLAESAAQLRQMFPTSSETEIRQQIARATGMSLEGYLHELREQMIADNGRVLLSHAAKASLYELWQEYLLSREEIEVELVAYSASSKVSGIAPTTAQMEEFFEKHRERFAVPSRVEITYVMKTLTELIGEIGPTLDDETLRAEYEATKDIRYKTPRQATVSHILVPIEGDRTEEEAMARAGQIAFALRAGASFETMADLFSEEIHEEMRAEGLGRILGNKGGRVAMPISEGGAIDASYTGPVLAMTPGTISDPFVATFAGRRGAFIVRAESIADAFYTPFETVQEGVRQSLATARAQEALDEMQEDWERAAEEHTTIDSMGGALSLPLQPAAWVDYENESVGFLPGVGSLRASSGLLRILKDEGGVGVARVGNALIAMEVTDTRQRYIPKSYTEDDMTSRSLSSRVRRQLAADEARLQAEELQRAAAAAPDLFAQLARERDQTPLSTGRFTRTNVTDGNLRGIEGFARKTLAAPLGSVHLDGAFVDAWETPAVYVVWKMTARHAPDLDTFKSEFTRLQLEYLANKSQGLIEEYLVDQMRNDRLRVEPNPRLLPTP